LEENCTKLKAAVSELKSTWCADYNQQLSEEKSVILHFGSQINGAAISTVHFGPDLSLEDGSVIKAAYSARHLGITLDARLSFSEFIHQRILKLRQVIGALKKLGHHRWGLSREFRMQSITGLIIPTLSFSAAAWAPILDSDLMDKFNTEWCKALKWAGGLEPTTSHKAVYAETGFTSVARLLQWRCSSTYARWRTLPHMQDVFQGGDLLGHGGAVTVDKASLSDATLLAYFVRYPWPTAAINIPIDMWRPSRSWERGGLDGLDIIIPANKDVAFQTWQDHQQRGVTEDVAVIYTDGSKSAEGVGAALFNETTGEERQWKLPNYASVFQAEALALTQAIETAPAGFRQLHVMTDSWSALTGLQSFRAPEPPVRRLRDAIQRRLAGECDKITLQWIPGHFDIPGNERADKLAKGAVMSELEPEKVYPSLQTIRTAIWKGIQASWTADWDAMESDNYVPSQLPTPADIQDLHRGLSIAESSALAQFRSGHTALSWSRSRFRRTPLPHCACGATETTFHFIVQCPNYDDLRFTLKAELQQAGASSILDVESVLDNAKSRPASAKFLAAALRRRLPSPFY
jgi:ribonuclease HI